MVRPADSGSTGTGKTGSTGRRTAAKNAAPAETAAAPAADTSENRTSTIKRIRKGTSNRVTQLAKSEHRDWISQLDILVDAGLRSKGLPGLFDEEGNLLD